MNNDISVEQMIIVIVLLIVLIVFFIIVLRNITKVKKGVNASNQSSENTRARLEDLDSQIQKLNEDNQEVIKVHKQIKEKSEAMNKMLKQTNRIYKEVLDKKSEVDTKDKDFINIDYDKLNKPKQANSGKELTQLIKNINSDKEQISNKVKPLKSDGIVEMDKREQTIDYLTKIDVENIKRMKSMELDELFLTLKDYRIILNKELDYYAEQIEEINDHKNIYSPSQRLTQKERIYEKIKEIEEKIDYQKILQEEVKRKKNQIEIDRKADEEEKKIDSLINDIIKRR